MAKGEVHGDQPSLPTAAEQRSLFVHLAKVFSRLEVTCVLDVGAHRGEYGQALRSLAGYSGRLISFEPVSSAYDRLQELTESDERWEALNVALGSRDEVRRIKVASNTVLTSFLEPTSYSREQFGQAAVVREERVTTVRSLDSLFDEELADVREKEVFLKLDTQGWDLEVLRGAQKMLPAIAGLQSELSIKPIYDGMPGYVEAISYMESKGFELSGIFPTARDKEFRLIEIDCVMIRLGEVDPASDSAARSREKPTA